MVASYETVEEVIKVVRRHVDSDTFLKIINDLKLVKGNASFENTIKRMHESVMKEKRKLGPR